MAMSSLVQNSALFVAVLCGILTIAVAAVLEEQEQVEIAGGNKVLHQKGNNKSIQANSSHALKESIPLGQNRTAKKKDKPETTTVRTQATKTQRQRKTSPRRTGTIYPRVSVEARGLKGKPTTGAPAPTRKELWCWLGPVYHRPFEIWEVPTQYCTHVVRCCVIIDTNGQDLDATQLFQGKHLDEIENFKRRHRQIKVLIGVGGPEMLPTMVKLPVLHGEVRKQLIQNLEALCQQHFADGVVLYVTNWLQSFAAINREPDGLYNSLHGYFKARSLIAANVLPADVLHLTKHFSYLKYVSQKRGPLIKIMHNVAEPLGNICPDPFEEVDRTRRYVDQADILAGLKEYFKDNFDNLLRNTLFTVSLRGSGFSVPNKSEELQTKHVSFQGHRCYQAICKKIKLSQWQNYHSDKTDCLVAHHGIEWWSSIGPKTGQLLTQYKNIRGAVVFFPECDDISDKCGDGKFSMIKHIADLLGIEPCQEC